MIYSTVKDVSKLLTDLGLRKGDIVLVHSNVSTLGKVENGLNGIFSAISEIIGIEGTVVVPTFTFSFCKGEVYDVQQSKSEKQIGVFPEYLRKLPGAVRSLQGITSFAAIGQDARILMSLGDKTSYGPGSVPANLVEAKSKVLQLGVPVISHTHYAERLVGVEYRYNKEFYGTIRNGSIEFEDACSLYVRRLDRIVEKLAGRDTRVEFFASDLCQEVKLAYDTHRLFNVEDFVSFTTDKLRQDPFCLINKDAYLKDID